MTAKKNIQTVNCSKCGTYAVTYDGKTCVSIRSGQVCKGIITIIMKNEPKEGIFRIKDATVIVQKEDDGRWHLSISCKNHQPSYKLIKESRYLFLPENIVVAQIFPPKSEFVNVHQYCHHLWEIFPQESLPPDHVTLEDQEDAEHPL